MKKSSLLFVGHNNNNDRKENDFYPTPEIATIKLLEKESFQGDIWECACGDGAISKPLLSKGYNVYSSDLIDRGYGETGIDFLKSNKKADNIITNPPFNLSIEFFEKAIELTKNKIAFLHKLTYLEGAKRNEKIFKLNKLKNIYVFSKRLAFEKNGKNNGLMCFAWFVFDVNYNGKPTIDWI